MEGPEPNLKRQQCAQEYARRRYLLLGVNLALSTLILSVFAFTGPATGLKAVLFEITTNRWGLIALYFLAFSLGHRLILALLSLYRGYPLPRQYGLAGLSNSFSHWRAGRAAQLALELTSHPSTARRIRRARDWQAQAAAHIPGAPPEAEREYPQAPVVGVGVAVLREGKILLVQRATEPLADQWSLPGGVVRLGERLTEAAVREVLEECGLKVQIEGMLETVERIFADEEGRVRYHYVIVDFWARPLGGEAKPSSDAKAVRWVGRGELASLPLTPGLEAILHKAFSLESATEAEDGTILQEDDLGYG
jgi:ADP-ribose pyrophosphatase YjhB (NUDIX family)